VLRTSPTTTRNSSRRSLRWKDSKSSLLQAVKISAHSNGWISLADPRTEPVSRSRRNSARFWENNYRGRLGHQFDDPSGENMRNTIPHHSKKFEPIPTVRSPSATRALQQVSDLGEFANSTRESGFGTNFVDSQDRRRAKSAI